MGGNSSKSDEEDKKNGIQEDRDGGESAFTAEASKNGSPQENVAPTKRRTSFYETVDASEVLPYLIIGNSTTV